MIVSLAQGLQFFGLYSNEGKLNNVIVSVRDTNRLITARFDSNTKAWVNDNTLVTYIWNMSDSDVRELSPDEARQAISQKGGTLDGAYALAGHHKPPA